MSATLENLDKTKLIELVQKYKAEIASNGKKISELQQLRMIVRDTGLSENHKIQALTSALEQKDQEQQSLKNKLDDLKAKFKKAAAGAEQYKIEVGKIMAELRGKVSDYSSENEELKRRIMERESYIEQLKTGYEKLIENLNDELDASKLSIKKSKDIILGLEKELQSKDNIITDLKQSLLEAEKNRAEIAKKFEEQMSLFKILIEEKCQGFNQSISLSYQRMAEIENKIEDLSKMKKQLAIQQYAPGLDDPKKFYDGIIQVDSLRNIIKGWNIIFKDHEKYLELIQKKGVVMTVVGNYNKGKTFLLELLSGQKAPHGFSISTEGLSIKYLENEVYRNTCPVIALDTQGGSLPIKTMEAIELAGQNPEMKYDDAFKTLLRDHHATEDILQNFIMDVSTLIIVVVSDLTFDDQKLVTKIKKKYEKSKGKTLIVLHNLYHSQKIEEVKNKYNDLIKGAFDLSESQFSFGTEGNHTFYEEDKTDLRVVHLLLAKEGSEAGNYFNAPTIQYLKSRISSAGQRKLDIVREFENYIKNNLSLYLEERKSEFVNSVVVENADRVPSMIKLTKYDQVDLKSISSDELGLIKTFSEGQYEPPYGIYLDDNHVVMKIEVPGATVDSRYRLENGEGRFRIHVKGNKVHDERDGVKYLIDTRNKGTYNVITPWIGKDKYDVEKKATSIDERDGTLVFKWPCEEIVNDGWEVIDLKKTLQ